MILKDKIGITLWEEKLLKLRVQSRIYFIPFLHGCSSAETLCRRLSREALGRDFYKSARQNSRHTVISGNSTDSYVQQHSSFLKIPIW